MSRRTRPADPASPEGHAPRVFAHRSAAAVRRWLIVAAMTAAVLTNQAAGQAPTAPADSTVIRVSLLERPIGRETFTLRSDGPDRVLTARLDLVDRGSALAVDSTLRVAGDYAPLRFTAKGKTYRFVNVDADVSIAGGVAAVRRFDERTQVKLPAAFFAAEGYAPLAGRALLVHYWERHGKPASIAVVPGMPTRDVAVRARGVDTVRAAGGGERRLTRYTVDGIVWGRETVWLDEDGGFAAIVTRIHILPMEAARDDLAEALPALQRSAVADRIADLAEMRQRAVTIAEGTYALAGATIVDGRGGPPIADGVVIVADGRIAAAGARSAVRVAAGIRAIDVTGTTIVPGFWDMHAHASQIEWAPAYLAAGVTTIRDMGGEERFLTAFRDALAGRGGLGPRLLLAGLIDGESTDAFGTVTAATADQARAIVERYHAAGFQQMKLYTQLSPEAVAAIVSRAHALKMTVTGHVPASLGLARAVEAGMDQIAHLPIAGDPSSPDVKALLDLLARRRTVLDPTLPWNELLGRAPATTLESFEPGARWLPQPLAFSYRSVTNAVDAAAAEERLRRQLAMLRALKDAGVASVAGTDGALPGVSVLRSIELFVRAGFSPMEALQSATAVPAAAMSLADSGTIEPGRRADLVVLDGSPLQNIANIRRTRWVVAAGRAYDSRALWRLAGFRPDN
jgi:imidazolonepropionase-like amidohydrolase